MTQLAILGTRGIPARYGGFETFAEQLSTRLVHRGFSVTVFCEAQAGAPAPESYRSVTLRYVKPPNLGPLSTILFDLQCLWLARKEFDVVYLLGYGAAIFCWLPRLWGTQVWINVDGIEWRRSKWGRFARMYLRAMESAAVFTPNRVIADAAAVKAELQSRHRHMPPCSVIAYGCNIVESIPDPEILKEWGLACGEYYLVVCRMEPENHPYEILTAFNKLSTRRQLVMVGNSPPSKAYGKLLMSIRDCRTRFIGAVYDSTKLAALRYHSAAYLHGHSVGGTNPSLLEAMASSNLIIAHRNPFNEEVLGAAGFYFSNATDLACTLSRIDGHLSDFEGMRAAVRIRAGDVYSWDSIVSQYESLIRDEVLSRK